LPEGNTIHRLAREHNRDFSGHSVRVSSPHGHFASEARRLDGRVFQCAEARGKHLFHHWQGNLIVHVHLGMFGWFYRRPGPPSEPRQTVRMRLTTREVTYDLIGPPTLELVTAEKRRQILERLGPDPIAPRADPERFQEALASTDVPVAHALIDQRIVSGVGNIYRAEALYLTGIHPLRKASSLTEKERERLWQTLRALMRRGARQGITATVAPEDLDPEERRSSDSAFYVYQRERCRRCGRKLRRFPLSGRTIYACAGCQPLRAPRQSK
jgi:endonuclease-8